MRKIKLTQGRVSLVDDEDYDRINQYKWFCTSSGYAIRNLPKVGGKQSPWRLHWEVVGKPLKGLYVDHINGNKLDNRKSNLRIVTRSENQMNRVKSKNNTSGFKGVSWYKANKKWAAYISVGRKRIHLGLFTNKKAAYQSRCLASVKYHGEFAKLK